MVDPHNSCILHLLQHRYTAPTIIMFNYLKELKEVRKQFAYKRLEEEPECADEGKKKEEEKVEEEKKSGNAYADVYGAKKKQ